MRWFQKIAEGIDVFPLVHAIQRQPELWDQNTLRTTYPGTPHAEVSDIWCWFNDTTNPEAVINDREVISYPAWSALPQLRPIVFNLMRAVEGVQLGRVIISRLPPGKTIAPHADGGAPATFYERYQIALQSLPGCLFKAGDETVQMQTGSVYWFDNQQIHSVINHSADDRISLIIDIRTA